MIRLRPRHVRTRLALWYVLVLGVVLVVYAAGTSTFFFFGLREELDSTVIRDFDTLEGWLVHHPVSQEPEGTRYFEVWSSDGELQHRSSSLGGYRLGGPPSVEESNGRLAPVSLSLPDGTRLRMVSGPTFLKDGALVIRLAHSEEKLWRELRELLAGISFGIALALAAAGLGGYLLARRALAPIDAMTHQAAKISAENLNERLAVDNPDDELGQLASVLNQSLERVQAGFQQLRRFTADASHELRTPLTVVRAVGEVALQNTRPPEEYREAIGSMLEELDRLTRLVDGLLTLSRADAGPVILNRAQLALGEAVRESVSLLEVLAEEKGQTVLVEGDPSIGVSADPLVLRQALINLVDNAIKYSPAGAEVRIRIGRRGLREAFVEVIDHGPGIPQEHRLRVFERFYRADPARSRELGGAGLGLAIAEWAVRAHGGGIELESEQGRGSTFRVVLPV